MIEKTKSKLKKKRNVTYVVSDIKKLPFKPGSFSTIILLRFVFHQQDLRLLLKILSPLLKKGGSIIFDTYRWSPRAFLSKMKHEEEKIFCHDELLVRSAVKGLPLKIIDIQYAFLFSTQIYRHLPFLLVRTLHNIEKFLPKKMLNRLFIKVQRT